VYLRVIFLHISVPIFTKYNAMYNVHSERLLLTTKMKNTKFARKYPVVVV